MPELPVWLQRIRDRANKATPGPWTAEDANPHKRFAFYIPAIMSAPSMPQYDGLTTEDAEFIAHSRTDVPRLLELVGEMATRLIAAYDALGELKGEVMENYMVQSLCRVGAEIRLALAKYRGEAEGE